MPSIAQNIYRLKNIGLPAMTSLNDFANEIRLSSGKISYLSSKAESHYKTYYIPKVSGKVRLIAQPSRELKAIQAWILRNILDKLSVSSCSKGFELGTSILDNAIPHIGSNFILTIDLKDFFPNVAASKVYGVFNSIGYNKELSTLLTNLCTYDGGLPQGAPTSPKLANLVCAKLDARIQGYAGSRGIVYTRYADDMTFSANTITKIIKTKQFIGTIISDEGFKINNNKTVVCGTKRQKKITGLILSENNVGIGRMKYREIRVKIHHLFIDKSSDYAHINGMLAYVYSVDRKSYNKLYSYIASLTKKNSSSIAIDNIAAKKITKNYN
ncbi:retron St85 family RNA-directed DNA polymerase [Photobacterium iliopiscarium]|uniref:retron St85 family RNA-directed DNA polymerase n=1 Tax=Photobacterium iliopiscarium TaxID=56192 RepID=UPI00242A4C28|nr:retron St85 family RNA-directed DNA polymerase [Photobacterium iliopiscarium]